jgi:ABC-type nickel/cobalt efflux system permease component RcnA
MRGGFLCVAAPDCAQYSRLIALVVIAAVTGLIAGAVHVWTGPDHLTAIAPLAVRSPKRAWVPGVRWGVGHSAGVIIVGLLSLWLRQFISVAWLSTWGERLVGVMLFGIGLWALRAAFKHNVHAHQHEHHGEPHLHIHTHAHGHAPEQPTRHRHTHAAFGIGTLHGMAGSSHLLGVLPALALRTKLESVTYLVAFGVGTVAAMAVFSWGMGWITTRFGGRGVMAYRSLMGTTAVVAMGVGCFWLATSW